VFVVETSGPAETEALGAELATGLHAGDLVLVLGELGAGKTTLVRGAARGLGVSDPVTSPTFGIGHRYRGAALTVAHLDLYRLGALEREDPGLLDDYIGPGSIAFVEWPKDNAQELRDAALRVKLAHAGGDRRRIEVHDAREPGAGASQGHPRDGGATAGAGRS
jgi:tRNA threonylcarbamoyladenosine biosynthesis protein TsaE